MHTFHAASQKCTELIPAIQDDLESCLCPSHQLLPSPCAELPFCDYDWDSADRITTSFISFASANSRFRKPEPLPVGTCLQLLRRYSLKQDSVIFFHPFSSGGLVMNPALRVMPLGAFLLPLIVRAPLRWPADPLTHCCPSTSHPMSQPPTSPPSLSMCWADMPCPDQSVVCRWFDNFRGKEQGDDFVHIFQINYAFYRNHIVSQNHCILKKFEAYHVAII